MKRSEIAARLLAASMAFTLVLPQASIVAMAEEPETPVAGEVVPEEPTEGSEEDPEEETPAEPKEEEPGNEGAGEDEDDEEEEEVVVEPTEDDEIEEATKSDEGIIANDVVVEDGIMTLEEVGDTKEVADEVPTVADGKAVLNGTTYDTLSAAMEAAQSGDTIYLGKGKYTGTDDQGKKGTGAGKSLTFVGTSTGDTTFEIQNAKSYGSDQHANYAFDGSDSITFKDMTLQMPSYQYDSGFVRVNHMTLENCVFNGNGAYWGYQDTTFKNVTFNPQDEVTKVWIFTINKNEYAVYTKTGNSYTFDGCTFNIKGGKAVKVYKDGASGNDTIYFNNCTVSNSTGWTNKQILCIDDSRHSATIYITGTTTISGESVPVDSESCSRLFGFGSTMYKGNKSKSGDNHGNTTVYIEGEKVFEKGALIDHEHGFIDNGEYKNGKVDDNHYDYSEGHKDDAYTTTEGDWVTDEKTGLTTREIIKTCNYCGWSSKKIDTKTETQDLPGDLLINGDNTEHDDVVSVRRGSTFSLTGALQVSTVQDQMAKLEKIFENPDGSSIDLSDIDFGFTATLTVPDGISLPDEVTATPAGMADTYKVASTEVSDKTVTVKFELTDEAKANIKTYADLKKYVDAAGEDGWLKITVDGCSVDDSVASGTQLTMTGTVGGTFSATATSQYGVVRSFSYEWNGKQWPNGKDAVAEDDDTIQLTIEVYVPSTPSEPDEDPEPTPTPAHTDDHPLPEQVQTIAETGNVEEVVVPETPVIEETGEVEEIQESGSAAAISTTGDDSQMMVYGIAAMMAAVVLAGWTLKRHI